MTSVCNYMNTLRSVLFCHMLSAIRTVAQIMLPLAIKLNPGNYCARDTCILVCTLFNLYTNDLKRKESDITRHSL